MMLRMKESQIKNMAQIQQIKQLTETFHNLTAKIERIKFLLDVKENEGVLSKIQQLDSSKQSLEDLKKGYLQAIEKINREIDGLREKIGILYYSKISMIITEFLNDWKKIIKISFQLKIIKFLMNPDIFFIGWLSWSE